MSAVDYTAGDLNGCLLVTGARPYGRGQRVSWTCRHCGNTGIGSAVHFRDRRSCVACRQQWRMGDTNEMGNAQKLVRCEKGCGGMVWAGPATKHPHECASSAPPRGFSSIWLAEVA